MASEELIRAKQELEALEAFRRSVAHDSWVASRKKDLEEINDDILLLDPVSREDEIEQFKLRGERRYVEGMVSYFEKAIEGVRDEISDLEDQEQEMSAVSPNEDSLSYD